MVTQAKPNPEVFLKAAELLQLPPAQCCVFEDAPAGVQAAKAAGMKVIGVGEEQVLCTADEVIPNFSSFVLHNS